MTSAVAFIGFGEVGSVFAAALTARGAQVRAYDVVLEKDGGLERLQARSAGTKVEFCRLSEALRGARYVLSTVTTDVAREAAQRCGPDLRDGQIYLDLNATDPGVKQEIERIVSPSCAVFVEGAVLGAVGVSGARTEILLGGPHARQAQAGLAGELDLNVRFYSEETGKASMFKMLRSVFSKGLEALLIEFLVAGERAGIRDDLWREVAALMADHPFEKTAANWVRSHASAHSRRYHEVRQVANVLRQLGVEPTITSATEAFFRRSGSLGLGERFAAPAATMDEVVQYFNRKLGRKE
jgi:3-hydroxyisobutyrate dehydrogenase-like beta-hydroxyacid dehydrogenase